MVREKTGVGYPTVFIHGISSSSRALQRQIEGRLAIRRRLVAIDLMGFGESDHASDPKAFLLSGQAKTLVAVTSAISASDAVFVGWSLGGHILLEPPLICRAHVLSRFTVRRRSACARCRGYAFAAALMLVASFVAARFAVAAERRSLEDVATPLSPEA